MVDVGLDVAVYPMIYVAIDVELDCTDHPAVDLFKGVENRSK